MIFDDILETGRMSNKQKKRNQLEKNVSKGKSAEDRVALSYSMGGYEVERTGRGHDFRVRKRDFLSGRITHSKVIEVKSGNAKLSKLQQKTKKKKSNYKVERINDDPFSLF